MAMMKAWMKSVGGLALVLLGAGLAGCSGLAKTDGVRFPEPAPNSSNFWGHACCYIDVGGVGIVTDPVFETTILLRHRFVDAPPPAAYAATEVVLISHAHPDHLSPKTIATFPASAVILCPEPAADHLKDMGRNVRVMRPGDEFPIAGGRIIAVDAHHMGGRYGVRAAADGRALGYVIEGREATIFYSGDTNYFSGFAHVGWTYRPDIALVNVNGHLCEEDATRAAWATGAPVVIPIHWGAFGYWLAGGNRKPRDADFMRKVLGERLVELKVGEGVPLSRRRSEAPALP